jgi:hypothetical protein
MFRKHHYIFMVFAVLLLFGSALPAFAQRAVAPAPFTPAWGNFPQWYQDENGVKLDLCILETPLSATGFPMCVLLADTAFNPVNPVSFPNNWPIEAFYFVADSKIGGAGGGGGGGAGTPRYRASVEASFLNGVVVPGDQMAFTRILVTFATPAAGVGQTYTITHPYGVDTVVGTAPTTKFKRDTILAGWTPPAITPPDDSFPFLSRAAGPFINYLGSGFSFIGDPNVQEAVTGAPSGNNFFRIDGPDIGGAGINFVQENTFAIGGVISGGTPPTKLVFDPLRPVTYHRSPDALGVLQGSVDVFATSTPTATLTITGAANVPAAGATMVGDAAGHYLGHIQMVDPATSALNASVVPANVTVSAIDTTVGTTLTTSIQPVRDVVTITKAVYDDVGQVLTVQATTSDGDKTAPPVLSVLGFSPGTMTPDASGIPTLVVTNLLSSPATVTVHSTAAIGASAPAGGSATKAVTIGLPPPPPATVEKLKVTSATFSKATATWSVLGHTTVPGAVVRIFNSPDLTAPLLGKATADGLGLFHFTLKGAKGRKLPNAADRISLKSSGKGKVMNKRVRLLR